ncbi:MAG: PaaI family thioesterase [Alphaproteobacteria bacterium]|nr:PaaI family thioesterase [Alphaproteobacteria bacterium]
MTSDVTDPSYWNDQSDGRLPALLGITVIDANPDMFRSRLAVRPDLLAPNGFLHAATIIALADTTCGFGSYANLPDGAAGFTTVELKSNFLGTARDGTIECIAIPSHIGRSTQVWDAKVTIGTSDKPIALFRCTQMVLWPTAPKA